MAGLKKHMILCKGIDFKAARRHSENFFDKSMLLHYEKLNISIDKSLNGTATTFWAEMDLGIQANRQVLKVFVNELKDAGYSSLEDFSQIPVGYSSKVFHIIAHILDGFVGIDSEFYNMLEDSHWVSDELRKTITIEPEKYWLLYVEGTFKSESAASLIHKV